MMGFIQWGLCAVPVLLSWACAVGLCPCVLVLVILYCVGACAAVPVLHCVRLVLCVVLSLGHILLTVAAAYVNRV